VEKEKLEKQKLEKEMIQKGNENRVEQFLRIKENFDYSSLFKKVETSSQFEKIPKMILDLICLDLPLTDLNNLSLVDKFFFNLIFNKENLSSQMIWKSKCEAIEKYDEKKNKEIISKVEFKGFDSKCNDYCLIYKYLLLQSSLNPNLFQYDRGNDEIFERLQVSKTRYFLYSSNYW
jgi:hypothetical protein